MSFAPLSFKASDSITAYKIVKLSAANTVAACSAATDKILGVVADDATRANQEVPVIVAGIAKVKFNDTCAAGNWVSVDANGLGIAAVATTAGVYVVGMLVGPTVALTGTIADVVVNPFQLQIP
jgi:hypothetical protein